MGVNKLTVDSKYVGKKNKILVFGFIDMNSMDGSAVFLSSLVNTLSMDKNIEIDFLLARPIIRDLLVKPLNNIDNVNIINPFEDPYFKSQKLDWVNRGFLNYNIVEQLIVHYWNQNNYDWLFVRSIETVEKLLKHKEIISKTMTYMTGLVQVDQEVSKDKINLFYELYKESAMLFCQTFEMKESIIKLLNIDKNNNKINVLSPMVPDVDSNLIRKNTKEISKIVYTGKFDKDWRSIEIISAFKELKRTFENLKLDIAGDKINKDSENPYFQEDLLYLLKNTNGVVWHGAVPRSFAQDLIINSDIGITWRSERMDGSLELSTKLLEYGSYRKAVIMNPTKMHIDLFGVDYPLYAVDEKDFREAIKKCITNPDIYEFAAQRMYEVSMKFTFSEAIKKLQPIIWESTLNHYLSNIDRTVYIEESISNNSLKEYMRLPNNLLSIKSNEINLLVNLSNVKNKILCLNKISGYGKISEIDKIGCFDIISIKKNKLKFEKNLENNLEFYKDLGSSINTEIKVSSSYEVNVTDTNSGANEKNNLEIIKIEQQNNNLNHQLNEMKRKYEIMQRKYNSLSNSKLGKITLNYWRFKKNRKLKFE